MEIVRVKCKDCNNEVNISHLDWNATDESMIPAWNEKNDVNVLIKNLEEHIESCQKKLEKYKSKLPNKDGVESKLVKNYSFNIKCGNCSKERNFKINDTDFKITHTSTRNVGIEIENTFKKNYKCSKCGTPIRFGLNVFEYPIGYFSGFDIYGDNYFMIVKEQLEKIIK